MSLFDDIKISDLPTKVENNKILKAIIGITFTTEKQAEILAFSLYNTIQNEFKTPESTQFARIPFEIRSQDHNFKNKILYSIVSKDNKYRIEIGDDIFNLSIDNFSYETWQELKDRFQSIYKDFQNEITKIRSFWIRYINIFDEPLSNAENFNFDFKLRKESLLSYPMNSSFEIKMDDRVTQITVVNQAKYFYTDKSGNRINKDNALAIDISLFYNKETPKTEIEEPLENSHKIIKKIFFGLCTEKFIKNALIPIKERK